MADQQDKPIYDEAKMRLMQKKIDRAKARRGGCMPWLLLVAAVFIGGMAVTIFPRMLLPIGGFLVCPEETQLDVTLGEKEYYIDSEGNESATTPIYLNCTRGYQVVQALGDGALLLIGLVYGAGLYLMMMTAYLIIRIYRSRNADAFEPPPPPIMPA